MYGRYDGGVSKGQCKVLLTNIHDAFINGACERITAMQSLSLCWRHLRLRQRHYLIAGRTSGIPTIKPTVAENAVKK